MIAGALLQQCYNLADTLIVGRYIGADALAAVGSSYALMVFILSVIIGLTLGSSTVFALHYGAGQPGRFRQSVFVSFVFIGLLTLLLNLLVFLFLNPILLWLNVPSDVAPMMRQYLWIVFWGIGFTFVYNFYSCLLRSIGDSHTPLYFLLVSVLLNIVLDLLFIIVFGWGISGAALATLLSQVVAAAGLLAYSYSRFPLIRFRRKECVFSRDSLKEIFSYSFLTCAQQSVMNLGILMVQGLVNSFGSVVMAAFAVGVRIDSFAYMPVQEFGNAFAMFTAQNCGADERARMRRGFRTALWMVSAFSVVVSLLVVAFATPLMQLFVGKGVPEVVDTGAGYLYVEGASYIGIGVLFLLYGYYRGARHPGFSLILTIVSLGTRVLLSWWLSSYDSIGVWGIWWSIPIGWLLADLLGLVWYRRARQQL